jgi:hypothetical protein
MKVILIRFLIGAVAVSIFALQGVLGDLFKPKSFAGLFGGAPSVALATLGLTRASDGRHFAATEAGSMIAGAMAFFVYASCVSWILMSGRFLALWVTISSLPVWAGVAFGLWYGWLK